MTRIESFRAPEAASARAVHDELRAAVGERGWTDDPADLAPHLADWRGRIHGRSGLLLLPDSVEAVQSIVRVAARHRIPLVPQGGNTGLVGGGIPDASGRAVVVSMRRMNRIRSVEPADYSMVAEAGVPLEAVHAAAADVDRMFPLSIASKGSATIGGLVSTNAGGVQVMRHGTMRALVLGLEAVLPDGSILRQLSPLRKDNTGYDVKQLLIGAEGTLGFVTAASLKLVPRPAEVVTALAGTDDPESVLRLLLRLRAATGDQLESFEIVPRTGLELVLRMIEGTRDPLDRPHRWYALIEAASPASGGSQREMLEAGLTEAMRSGEIGDAVIAENRAQAAALWRLREELSEADRRAHRSTLKHDVSVPVSRMAAFLVAAIAEVEERWTGTRVNAFGHVGDGNVHLDVVVPPDVDPAVYAEETGPAISSRVFEIVDGFGGSISAEHGIGTVKQDPFLRFADPAKLASIRVVKSALDPASIMNPGKILPA
jgi:FAD/FMN-containing dehydrogenase